MLHIGAKFVANLTKKETRLFPSKYLGNTGNFTFHLSRCLRLHVLSSVFVLLKNLLIQFALSLLQHSPPHSLTKPFVIFNDRLTAAECSLSFY